MKKIRIPVYLITAALALCSCDEPVKSKPMEVELFAERYQWTARYPGNDKVLGAVSYSLISDSNRLGINHSDPASADDLIIEDAIHLPAGSRVRFILRSRDVIHAAYLPDFKAAMNAVPGMRIQFEIETGITTDSARAELEDPGFRYFLLCNKICGRGHYDMKEEIIIESPAQYALWHAKAANANRAGSHRAVSH